MQINFSTNGIFHIDSLKKSLRIAALLLPYVIFGGSPLSAQVKLAKVVILEAKSIDEVQDPETREILETLKLPPLDPSLHPEVRPFLRKLEGMLENLLEEKDGNRPIQLVVVDDIRLNAGFLEMKESGKRFIFLNLGAVRFVNNDDELAHILSHELEHRTSDLESMAKALANYNDGVLFRRAIENEVDAKAAASRLAKHGYNPFASVEFLNRMAEGEDGGVLSLSHSNTLSRKHTTGLAIVRNIREEGLENKFRFQPKARQTTVTSGIKSAFTNAPAFSEWWHKRLEEFARQLNPEGLDVAYSKVLETGINHYPYENFYRKKYAEALSEAGRLGFLELSRTEQLEFELTLHRSLTEAFHAAKIRTLGNHFVASSKEQWNLLKLLDARSFDISAPDLVTSAIDLLRTEIQIDAIRMKLSRAKDNQEKSNQQGKLDAYEKKRVRDEEAAAAARLAYEDDGTLAQKVEQRLRTNLPVYSLYSKPAKMEEIGIRPKMLLDTIRTTFAEQQADILRQAPLLLSEELPTHMLMMQLEVIQALGDKPELFDSFFARLLTSLQREIPAGNSPDRGDQVVGFFKLWWNHGIPGGPSYATAFQNLSRTRPNEATLYLKKIFHLIGSSLDRPTQLESFFVGIEGAGLPEPVLKDKAVQEELFSVFDRVEKVGLKGAFTLEELGSCVNSLYQSERSLIALPGTDFRVRLVGILGNALTFQTDAAVTLSDYFSRLYRKRLGENASLPLDRRIEQTSYEFWKAVPPEFNWIHGREVLSRMMTDLSHGHVLGALNFLKQARRGAERFAEEVRFPDSHPEHLSSKSSIAALRTDSALEKQFLENPALLENEPGAEVIEFFRHILKSGRAPRAEIDRLYEMIWKKYGKTPAYRNFFLDSDLVTKLYYDENKLNLAKWQLEEEFHLLAEKTAIQAGKKQIPASGSEREKIS